MQGVNLSASTYWVPGTDSMQYLNYGAAISEVTVSTLHTQLVILVHVHKKISWFLRHFNIFLGLRFTICGSIVGRG